MEHSCCTLSSRERDQQKQSFHCVPINKLEKKMGSLASLAGNQISLCPILNPAEDPDDPVYPIVFFAGKAKPGTGTGSTVDPSSDPSSLQELTQDVVYVIDTTKSMAALLSGTKRIADLSASKILGGFSELQGKIRFGLVEYQDSTPGLFVSKVTIPLTSDLNQFKAKLQQVVVTSQGSEETKEDVLAGLKTAITDPKMAWNETSVKHIVLLGDASAHEKGPKNTTQLSLKEVIDFARPQGGGAERSRQLATITLHAIRAINPGDPSDHANCKKHFSTIAKNNNQEQGFYADVDPTTAQDVQDAVDDLVDLMSKSYATMSKITAASKSGNKLDSTPSDPASTGAFERKLWTLYGLSQAEEKEQVFEGFATETTSQFKTVADRRIMVRFNEVKRVASNLKFIYEGFKEFEEDEAGRKDVDNLLEGLQVLAASTGVGNLVRSSKLSNVISAMPLKSEVLNKSIDDIAIMTNDEFADFLMKIESSRKRALALLDRTDNWNGLSIDKSDGKVKISEKFSFLRVDELP